MEVLAPAGNLESLKVAVYNGANAVYFGLSKFNARLKADNFTLQNLNSTVEFCHMHNVKCYLAINTLIKNSEMNEAMQFVKAGIDAKIDAFILADMGLCYILKNKFSGIVMHASTQLGVHNLYGAKVAESLGFKRVILSRESKLADIIAIKKNTNLELEFFVQGALCVAFSGACLLSSSRCNKSGNRGECTQPCRLNYSLIDSNNAVKNSGKLLSTADLCLVENIKLLMEAGVTSLKIEGRNRRSSYVAVATKSYRDIVDNLTKPCVTCNTNLIKENLKKVFSRGDFNENAYLYEDKSDKVINTFSSGHSGIKIGKVVNCQKFKDIYKIDLNVNCKLCKGDGLKLFDNDTEVTSLGVGNVEEKNKLQSIFSTQNIKSGLDVHLILDAKEEKLATEKIVKLPVKLDCFLFSGKVGVFKLTYNNIVVESTTTEILESAIKSPTDNKVLSDVFNKNGETEFELSKVNLNTNDVFIRVSELNKIKTLMYANLKQEIINDYNTYNMTKITQKDYDLNSFSASENITEFVDTVENIKVTTNENVQGGNFVYAYNGMFNKFNLFYENQIAKQNKKICGLVLPNYASGNDLEMIDKNLDKLDKQKIFLIANNIYGLHYINKGYKVIGGISLNIYNNYAVKNLQNNNLSDAIIAPELRDECEQINFNYVATGYLPLATLCHCPFLTGGGNCKNCMYINNAKLKSEDGYEYKILRQKLFSCTFQLISSQKSINKTTKHFVEFIE